MVQCRGLGAVFRGNCTGGAGEIGESGGAGGSGEAGGWGGGAKNGHLSELFAQRNMFASSSMSYFPMVGNVNFSSKSFISEAI